MDKTFPDLEKEIDTPVQETQRVPIKMDPKRTTLTHIIIEMPQFKDKEKPLKSSKKETITYKGGHIRLSANFSTETLQARRIGMKYSK